MTGITSSSLPNKSARASSTGSRAAVSAACARKK